MDVGEGMRRARLKGEPDAEAAYYHCVSRIVDRRFVVEAREKEIFVRLMRGYEAYCGVRIITFCVMSNHFHILLEVPRRPPKGRQARGQAILFSSSEEEQQATSDPEVPKF